MKTASLLLVTIGWAVLMNGRAYAAPSNPVWQEASRESAANIASGRPQNAEHAATADQRSRQKDESPSDREPNRSQVSDKNHSHSRTDPIKRNRPKALPNGGNPSTLGNAKNVHQPATDKSGGAVAKEGFIQRERAKRSPAARQPSVPRGAAPSLKNVRHRDPNPAVIGGSSNSKTGSTGAINGTGLNHRP